jgi:uncharacterized repeat protein (TIGR01451 family)
VAARLGVVAYEGDLGITGDFARLDGSTLSDPCHPAGNFFDSTICTNGARVTTKNPDYVNQLGFDASLVDASGIIPNGAGGATIDMGTSGDTYYPGVITTAIDVFAPTVRLDKTVSGATGPGGRARRGDVLTYDVTATSTGRDPATDVVLSDAIPAGTTYRPGTLAVAAGANAGGKTDAAGDDQAELGSGAVTFRLGAGATAAAGGRLDPGETTSVRFQVTVDADASDSAVITDTARASYVGPTTGLHFGSFSNPAQVVVRAPSIADVGVTKTVDNPVPVQGDQVTFTVTATNHGPDDSTRLVVADRLPAGLTFVSAAASAGGYDPATGSWALALLPVGQSATLTITATAAELGQHANTATKASEDQIDNNTDNDVDAAAVVVQPGAAHLVMAKTHVGEFVAGGAGSYQLTVTNSGPFPTVGPATVTDTLPSGLAFGSGGGAGWSCAAAGQVVTCQHTAPLAAGETSSFPIQVAIARDAAGVKHNGATVVARPPDPLPNESTATDDVTISNLPAPPPTGATG